MGNAVRAATPPSTDGLGVPLSVPAPPSSPIPEQSSDAEKSQKVAATSELLATVTNPGTYEDLFKNSRELTPPSFDGFRFMFARGLSSSFQVMHNLSLSGGPQGSSYRFTPYFILGGADPSASPDLFMMGEIDGSGNVSSQIINQLTTNLKTKLVVQGHDNDLIVQAEAEYKTSRSTSTIALANIDILKESGIIATTHLQRLTQNIDLGAEYIYQYTRQPGQTVSSISLGGRYSLPNSTFSATVSPFSTHAALYYKANDNIQAGVDFDHNTRMQSSKVSLVYNVEVPKANIVFKAMVDTDWTVTSVLEKRLDGSPITLSLSGMLNHVKNAARFGIGLNLGQ